MFISIRLTLLCMLLISLLVIGGYASLAIAIPCGVMYALFLGSLIEWAVHRFLYHGELVLLAPLRQAHIFHHAVFAKEYMIAPSELPYRRYRGRRLSLDTVLARIGQVLLHWTVISLAMILPTYFFTHSFAFTLAASLTAGSLSLLNLYLHETMHRDKGRWIVRTRLFAWLNRHHREHHHNPQVNFNLVLPFMDRLLDTKG